MHNSPSSITFTSVPGIGIPTLPIGFNTLGTSIESAFNLLEKDSTAFPGTPIVAGPVSSVIPYISVTSIPIA